MPVNCCRALRRHGRTIPRPAVLSSTVAQVSEVEVEDRGHQRAKRRDIPRWYAVPGCSTASQRRCFSRAAGFRFSVWRFTTAHSFFHCTAPHRTLNQSTSSTGVLAQTNREACPARQSRQKTKQKQTSIHSAPPEVCVHVNGDQSLDLDNTSKPVNSTFSLNPTSNRNPPPRPASAPESPAGRSWAGRGVHVGRVLCCCHRHERAELRRSARSASCSRALVGGAFQNLLCTSL